MPSDGALIPRMRQTRRVGVSGSVRPARLSQDLALTPRGLRLLDTTPEVVLYWMQHVTRERAMRAHRIYKRGIEGTLPEYLSYDWLDSRNRQFDFQTSLMGGRVILGGAVADFIIFDLVPDGLVIWRVQGDYWHTQPDRVQEDFRQRERLLMASYMGVPVAEVVDLWESAIYYAAPYVFEAAEAGREIGRRVQQ